MENMEALTYILALLALAAGIVVSLTMPFGQVIAAIAVAYSLIFLCFSPLTAAWFAHTMMGEIGVSEQAFEAAAVMAVCFGLASAAALAINVIRGRVHGGLPPAV